MTSAREIVSRLKGTWQGRQGTCRCPVHEDRTPSLSITETRDGRVLVYCFAGCSQAAVIAALRHLGLWHGEAVPDPSYPHRLTTRADGVSRDERERQEIARRLWRDGIAVQGTVAETYLRKRGITLALPDVLRFCPGLRHGPSGLVFPVLLASIQDGCGAVVGVQRTYLAPDGNAKAPVDGPKRSLGRMADGAVRLGPAAPFMGIAEGIETALSAREHFGLSVWAVLGANRLKAVALPPEVERLWIFADAGKVGIEQAIKAADYFEYTRGIRVEIEAPEFGDWNDAVRRAA